MLDLYASAEHYADHLWPVWSQLTTRGLAQRAYSARSGDWWRSGVLPRPIDHRGVQPVIVGSYVDYQRTHPAPVVYVEHGAGQTYDGDTSSASHPSYSGGDGFDRVILFVCPSELVAARWRERYRAPAVVVGSPKLDAWHDRAAKEGTERVGRDRSVPVVAVTFHWDCPLVPETRSAWRHYDRALPELVQWARSQQVELLGHGHPRIWRALAHRWEQLGVEPVRRFDDVLARAGCLVGDNTSALFEFASCDRPVVVLNAPWYRRDVEHGGRFWTWADVGVQCDEPGELRGAVDVALADPERVRANRGRIITDVYAHRDGQAAARAADAISEVLHHANPIHRPRSGSTARGF